jgi:heme-degrading monooxygenase HmoA
MHAVVVKVTINDAETAEKILREEVVPRVSDAPGFVAGYWARSEDGTNGLAMVVWDSEESARAAVEVVRNQASQRDDVTLNDVEVREVVAHASSGSQD